MESKTKALQGYRAYLREVKGFKTDHSVKKYARRAEALMDWASEECYPNIDYNVLMKFVEQLKSNGDDPKLINAKLTAIKYYFDFENDTNCIFLNVAHGYNPASGFQVKGVPQKIMQLPLDMMELDSLYTNYAGKYKAMLGLIIFQGFKAIELEKIEVVHFNFKDGTVYIPPSQYARSRKIKLDAQQTMDLLPVIQEKKDGFLFCSDLKNDIYAMMKKVRQINPSVKNAHHLRASLIVHWIQSYGLRKAQYLAGHKTVAGTEKYKNEDTKALQIKVNELHPLNNRMPVMA